MSSERKQMSTPIKDAVIRHVHAHWEIVDIFSISQSGVLQSFLNNTKHVDLQSD